MSGPRFHPATPLNITSGWLKLHETTSEGRYGPLVSMYILIGAYRSLRWVSNKVISHGNCRAHGNIRLYLL
jgi:hypothetical protein